MARPRGSRGALRRPPALEEPWRGRAGKRPAAPASRRAAERMRVPRPRRRILGGQPRGGIGATA
eukprot:8407830-Alexandrium_andersonii.AAC.1